jgi:hypothetical protein
MRGLPAFPHIVGLAPEDHPGRVSELLATGEKRLIAAFTFDPGFVEVGFRRHRELLRAYLRSGSTVLCACQNARDRAEARRRLRLLARPGCTVREP